MSRTLCIAPDELATVRSILERELPEGFRTFVFGSRAGGHPKPWSDLDILIEGAGPMPLAAMAKLREAFDESALAWKVDLVDRSTVDAAFGVIIDRQKVPFD